MRHYYNPSNFKQYKPRRGWRQRFLSLFKGDPRKRRLVQYSSPLTRSYLNPWKKRRFDWRTHLTAWLLGAVILTWLGLMIYLPYFRIKSVSFEGLKIIKQEEINQFIWDNYLSGSKLWPANNYFLVSESKIKNDLLKQYSLNGVEVKKVFPGQLNIKVEEKISSIIYDNGQNYYLLDKGGNVLKYLSPMGASEFRPITPIVMPPAPTSTPASPELQRGEPTSTQASATVSPLRRGSSPRRHVGAERGSELAASSTTSTPLEHSPDYKRIKKDFGAFPLVFDLRQPPLSDKQTEVLPANLINAAIDWYGALEKRGIAGIRYFTLEQPSAGLTIYTNLPWRLYVSPDQDLETQLENLKIILRDNNPREYIDLRYGERVFWK